MDRRLLFQKAKRVVIKVGTNSLTGPDNGVDGEFIGKLSQQICRLMDRNYHCVLVSSGAIGFGATSLGLKQRPNDMAMKQACAALGQPQLMDAYVSSFARQGRLAAQLLVTRQSWNDRSAYLNLRTATEQLLSLGTVPVVNENDVVSTEEIGTAFGDNDKLSSLVASKLDADLLIILSDIDGLYTANPKLDPSATLIDQVDDLTAELMDLGQEPGSEFSTGGIGTKLQAVAIARDAGCSVVLANSKTPNVVERIMAGESIGTLFTAPKALQQKKRWLKHAAPEGYITIDQGAMTAIARHNSLLASGLVELDGNFERGAVILVNTQVKLVSNWSSGELRLMVGKSGKELREQFGGSCPIVARPDDMVFLPSRTAQ